MILKYGEDALLAEIIDVDTLQGINLWMKELIDGLTPQILDILEPNYGGENITTSALNPKSGDPYEQLYSHPCK